MKRIKKVLIVDDDASFAESNRDLLQAHGYEVYLAKDGAAGLEMAKKIKPDLMILDVMMATDTEGFEVARKIPELSGLKNNMGVLLVTGITNVLGLPRSIKPDDTWLPVDRIIDKPIVPDRLISEVKRVLRKKDKERKK
jgi:DNA-binding response OmpR family regulator